MSIEPCKPRQASSFVVDEVNRSIMFLPCGVISFKPSDVTYRYCEQCKRFITKTSSTSMPDGKKTGRSKGLMSIHQIISPDHPRRAMGGAAAGLRASRQT